MCVANALDGGMCCGEGIARGNALHGGHRRVSLDAFPVFYTSVFNCFTGVHH